MPIVKGFRRFHSNFVSSTSRQVATEISNLVSGSNVEQPGRSPLNSNRPIRRKRINNAERKEMLESFVNKYRAMNLGKFPSTTTAQKEVGGGYYSIKKMLQEMEYNFKMSPVEEGYTKENIKHVEKGPANDQNLCENHSQESGGEFDNNTGTGNSNTMRVDTQKVATESEEKPEHNPRDDNFSLKDPKSQVEKQPDGIRNVMRDKEEDNELREEASLWGNLKSMANEFINMWKK